MTALILYLNGKQFQSIPLILPGFYNKEFTEKRNFETQAKIREKYIYAQLTKWEQFYQKQIIQAKLNYQFILILESKINEL